MATLTEMYTRIILNLDRDDMGSGGAMEQAKIDAVTDAIDHYKTEQFWFNRASGSGATTASDATLTMPSGVYVPKSVAYSGETLERVPLAEIEYRTETGLPHMWAENEETIQLWPIPDAAYTIYVYGTADVDAPAAGAANIWTTEAYALILARAKKILCRDSLRDTEGASLAQIAEDEALSRLRRETIRRGASRLHTEVPQRYRTFNINRGW